MVTGKSKREYRKLMMALKKSNEVRDSDLSDTPEISTSPSPSSRVVSGPLGADDGLHRDKYVRPLFPFPACVARPVGKAEISREPKAKEALQKEWGRLIARCVWDTRPEAVREWRDVAADARRDGSGAHMGMLFEICVEKESELAPALRKYKGRVVFQGNAVKN